MGIMAEALVKAGLTDEKSVRRAAATQRLMVAVRRALNKAQRSGASADWSRYATLKRTAPRDLQFAL